MSTRYIFTLFLLAFISLNYSALAQKGNSIISISETFHRHLENSQFTEATSFFDSTVRSKLSPQLLENTWNALQKQMGNYREQGQRIEEKKELGYSVISRECVFEKGSLELRLVFNAANEISGIFFRPMEEGHRYIAPAYDREETYQARILDLENGEITLPGRLLIPKNSSKKKFPVVVLVHGSGPNDMDETIGPNKPFRDLATGLASKGIATYRYQKRTLVYAKEMAQNKQEITIYEETVDDALETIRMLKEIDEIDTTKIFVLGHSMGGMLAPLIAEKASNLNGIILLAANARPLEDLIWDQMNYLLRLDGLSGEEKKQLRTLKSQIKRVKSSELSHNTPDSLLPLGLPANYWVTLKNYNQKLTAKKLDARILVLQGARDYQVTLKDYRAWKKTLKKRENANFILYPQLNHLFIKTPSKSQVSTPEEYRVQGNVQEELVDDLINWINK